jgi:hypothetical protein
MKRLLVALATILLAGNVYAAQQEITAVSVPETLGGYRGAVNARFTAIDENFDELYGQSDSDVIAALNCTTNQIAKWNGTAWVCAADVDTNTTYTAGTGLTLVGTEFRNTVANTDTIAALSCTSGQVAKWNGSAWACAADAVAEAGTGDDLGDATAGDVAALFSGEGEYLKTDGSTGTPSGSGLTDGTAVGDIPVWDGTSYEPETPAEITFAGSVSYDEETNTVTGTDDQTASEVPVTATGFTGNLSGTDTNVQTALETLDALVIGEGDGLPAGGDKNDILVRDSEGDAVWMAFEDHPAYIALVNLAGLNSFTFTPDTPASYPYYIASDDYTLDFEITDSNTSYAIDTVEFSLDSAAYTAVGITNPSGDLWRITQEDMADAEYTYQLEVCDDKDPANCGESAVYTVIVDRTYPIVQLIPQ